LDADRDPLINLSKPENTVIIIESLKYWDGKKLNNWAFSIMSNHVHWVFEVLEKDTEDNPVYLQDLMQSVKRFSSNQINKLERKQGSLWQKESFDTTIRDEQHLYNAIKYTLNNPVAAGLVPDWKLWPGTFLWSTCSNDF
jgi:REP element-mobilizing transposase RayT